MSIATIVLGNLRRRKSKVILMLLGIVIGIATMVSVFNVVSIMQNKLDDQLTGFGANVVITPDFGGLTFSYGGMTLPEILYDVRQLSGTDLEKLSQLPSSGMITAIAPRLILNGLLENGLKVTVIGADLDKEFRVKPWLAIRSGILDSLDNEEVILGHDLADRLLVREGDLLLLERSTFMIRHVFIESGEAEDSQIFMNLQVAQKIYDRPGEITVVDLAIDYAAGQEDALLAEISGALPHAKAVSLRQESLRRDTLISQVASFGMAISLIIVFTSMLTIGITMAGAVRERTREIGVFRALGFRKSHIVRILLAEAALVSAVGGVAGYFSGNMMAGYAGQLLVGDVVTLEWRISILLIAIAISVGMGLVSGFLPAMKAARLDPAEALRFL